MIKVKEILLWDNEDNFMIVLAEDGKTYKLTNIYPTKIECNTDNVCTEESMEVDLEFSFNSDITISNKDIIDTLSESLINKFSNNNITNIKEDK